MNKQIEEIAFTDVDVLANDLNQHCADLADNYCGDTNCVSCLAHALYNAGYRKQSEEETIDYLYEFKSLLINKFIELCNYNDYGKINLLLIGDTIDETFDDVVAKMKGGE